MNLRRNSDEAFCKTGKMLENGIKTFGKNSILSKKVTLTAKGTERLCVTNTETNSVLSKKETLIAKTEDSLYKPLCKLYKPLCKPQITSSCFSQRSVSSFVPPFFVAAGKQKTTLATKNLSSIGNLSNTSSTKTKSGKSKNSSKYGKSIKSGKIKIYADHGPPERWQHSERKLEIIDKTDVPVARALEENLLDILELRGWISDDQREAALRLKQDFQYAGLAARLGGGYNPLRAQFSPLGPWDERTDAEEAAYQRWRNAVKAIGILYSDIVISTVCHDYVPAPTRIFLLRKGLEKLVKWYGIRKSEIEN